MWRLANCIYRVFRNSATYYYSQDVLGPFSIVYNTDNDSKLHLEEKQSSVKKCDLQSVLKNYEFSSKNVEKLHDFLKKFSTQLLPRKSDNIQKIEPKTLEPSVPDVQSIPSVSDKPKESVDSSVEHDENLTNTLNCLTDLHEATMSLINLQLALEDLECGNFEQGIETLQTSIKTKPNAAALYNLGICYERGIGVESDRAKACDYYRQAANLGHINAQFNLTLLSNHIDTDESDHETIEEISMEKPKLSLYEHFFRFSLSNTHQEDDNLWSDHSVDFKNQTVACLS